MYKNIFTIYFGHKMCSAVVGRNYSLCVGHQCTARSKSYLKVNAANSVLLMGSCVAHVSWQASFFTISL